MFKERKGGRARQLCFEQSVKKTDTAAVIWKQFAIGYGEVDPPRFERGSLFQTGSSDEAMRDPLRISHYVSK